MRNLALLGFALAIFATGCQPAPVIVQTNPQNQGLKVSGTATVRVKPTLVVVHLGVSHTNPRPSGAKSATEEAIRKIAAAVKAAGVGEKDLQTTRFQLSRGYNSRGEPSGWQCSTQLELRIKDVDRASAVLEAALDAGANQVSHVDYTVEELQEVRAQARDEACRVAKSKADQYAKNFGLKLGAPTAVSENAPENWGFYGSNRATQSMMDSGPAESAAEAEQILSSGSVAVTLTVQVTYPLMP